MAVSSKWEIWALLDEEEEKEALVQSLRRKIFMLEAPSAVCHHRKTDRGRVSVTSCSILPALCNNPPSPVLIRFV